MWLKHRAQQIRIARKLALYYQLPDGKQGVAERQRKIIRHGDGHRSDEAGDAYYEELFADWKTIGEKQGIVLSLRTLPEGVSALPIRQADSAASVGVASPLPVASHARAEAVPDPHIESARLSVLRLVG
jgi:hypothetical protein